MSDDLDGILLSEFGDIRDLTESLTCAKHTLYH